MLYIQTLDDTINGDDIDGIRNSHKAPNDQPYTKVPFYNLYVLKQEIQ